MSYEIVVDDLSKHLTGLQFNSNNDDTVYPIIDYLFNQIRMGNIPFPFHRDQITDPSVLFDNIKMTKLPIDTSPYVMRSYLPKYNSYLPPKFRGKYLKIIRDEKYYYVADILSDYFVEDVRLQARKNDQLKSMLECWYDDYCIREKLLIPIFKSKRIDEIPKILNPSFLRKSLYNVYSETGTFNPTGGKAILEAIFGTNAKLEGLKWLDMSAGWGDRLIIAMVLKMFYVAFDPNINLKQGHDQMIDMFGDKNMQKIYYEPFETANILGGPFDFCFTSTPFFDIEIYNEEQTGQSTNTYPKYTEWMVWFLFRSITRAWENIKYGGYLILHLGDNESTNTTEQANIFIENFLPGSSWEGTIGLAGSSGFARPVWVWKKLKPSETKIWDPEPNFDPKLYNPKFRTTNHQLQFSNRSLLNCYPILHKEYMHFFCSEYSPNYLVRYKNILSLLSVLASSFFNKSFDEISSLLDDNLKLHSMIDNPINLLLEYLGGIIDDNKNLAYVDINDNAPTNGYQQMKSIVDKFWNELYTFWGENYPSLIGSPAKTILDDLMIYSLLEFNEEQQVMSLVTGIILLSLKM